MSNVKPIRVSYKPRAPKLKGDPKRYVDALPETRDYKGVEEILGAAPFIAHKRLGPVVIVSDEGKPFVCTLDEATSVVWNGQDESAENYRHFMRKQLRDLVRAAQERGEAPPLVQVRIYAHDGAPIETWRQTGKNVIDQRYACPCCTDGSCMLCDDDGLCPEDDDE